MSHFYRPEDVERVEKSSQAEVERAEANLRSLEREKPLEAKPAEQQAVNGPPTKGVEAPRRIETFPNGRDVVVIGDPAGDAVFNHQQGQNQLGYQGDCGLVACKEVLNQHGLPVTENDIVVYADKNNICANDPQEVGEWPRDAGGTRPEDQAKILSDHGIPAHVEHNENVQSLAQKIEQGRSVIVEVNADRLWDQNSPYDRGYADHAVLVTGVVRDNQTQKILGFTINDSGDGQSGKFIDAGKMEDIWVNAKGPFGQGRCVVTDSPRPWR